MHQNFHSLCQGLWLMGAAWHCGSGQEGVSTSCCSYPAHKEKLEPKQGPVLTAQPWGAPELSKMACDAPQIPFCSLATGWKDWSCFHSHPGVLLKSLATALVCGSVTPCLPKRAPDRSDEELGGLCIVLCFVLISWSASGCSLLCGASDHSRIGSSLEAAPGCASGKQWFGSRAVGTHRQVFHLLGKGVVLIHDGSRTNGKSSKAAFAHIWLQLAVLGVVLFLFLFFLIKQE